MSKSLESKNLIPEVAESVKVEGEGPQVISSPYPRAAQLKPAPHRLRFRFWMGLGFRTLGSYHLLLFLSFLMTAGLSTVFEARTFPYSSLGSLVRLFFLLPIAVFPPYLVHLAELLLVSLGRTRNHRRTAWRMALIAGSSLILQAVLLASFGQVTLSTQFEILTLLGAALMPACASSLIFLQRIEQSSQDVPKPTDLEEKAALSPKGEKAEQGESGLKP